MTAGPDTVDGLAPRRVAAPADRAEVQAIVREVAASGEALVATGLGAHLDVGAPPRRLDVLVRLARLDRIIDYQPADMTITTEAGCALGALDAALGETGQWLPLDPPHLDRTTVGGLVATNLSGPLATSQGTVRDILLGLRIVGADGAIVAGGGKVVKNVAGYDLPKLHVGALGTLGVLVEATFKVRPRPEREEAAVVRARDLAEATAFALAVRAAFDPLWLETGTLDDGPGTVVGVGGIAPEIAAAQRRIADLARARTIDLEWISDGAALRHRLGGFAGGPAAAVLRASVLPTDVPWVVTAIADTAGAATPVRARPMTGVVYARVEEPDAVSRLVATLRPHIESRGGFLVVERAAPGVKSGLDPWGDPGPGLPLMRRVKTAFDPGGVFAAGRYAGGI